jgi:hypothetical protein
MIFSSSSLPMLFFEMLRSSAKNNKVRQCFLMIWHATLWSIRKNRNSTIFANGSFNPKMLVNDIKVLSWK